MVDQAESDLASFGLVHPIVPQDRGGISFDEHRAGGRDTIRGSARPMKTGLSSCRVPRCDRTFSIPS